MLSALTLLERLASAPRRAALLLDFDGVLAPIVPVPADARLPAETRVELERLAGRYALVAIVSGREAADVRNRVNLDGIAYVGSHGLELAPGAASWREPIRRFAERVEWPERELKALSVSFHFRNVPDERAARAELERVARAAEAAGFRARFGRKVLEVLPPLAVNKGTAVRSLLVERRLGRALVAGDDTTDLDAFHALDGLELAVRVAVASAESPAALRAAADVVVTDTGAFLDLLRRL
jgi:trehalose 6-phosphate phosphatase